MNNGCCFTDSVDELFKDQSVYEQRQMEYGPCHSCDYHETGFCQAYGNPRDDDPNNPTPWEDCIKLAGCTWDDANTQCLSAEPEEKIEELTCESYAADIFDKMTAYSACVELKKAAEEEEKIQQPDKELREMTNLYLKSVKNNGCMELYYYIPQCLPDDLAKYNPYQHDSIGQYFCVDENGHEIPDTRKAQPLQPTQNEDGTWTSLDIMIDCEKERVKHVGFQCPNAMTLTTQGGVVSVNVNNDALDCKNECNTDQDCTHLGSGDDHWCCFNGCAYTCKKPVLPFSGCAAIPKNRPGQMIHEAGDRDSLVEAGAHREHKMQIEVSCESGWDVIPLDQPQSVILDCKHGNWEICDNPEDRWDCSPEFDLKCEEQCDPFDIHNTEVSIIDDLKMRERDFVIEGNDNHYSATRKISCAEGYGIVAGDESAVRDGYELLTCSEGKQWLNYEQGHRSIECSVCFDSPTWRDEHQNNCDYYKSRVMECFGDEPGVTTPQEDHCRVACRSCLRAEAKYGKKERRSTIVSVLPERRSNWDRIRMKVLKEKTRIVEKTSFITVTNLYPVTEVCQPDDSEAKPYHGTKNQDGVFECPEGGSLMQEPEQEQNDQEQQLD